MRLNGSGCLCYARCRNEYNTEHAQNKNSILPNLYEQK